MDPTRVLALAHPLRELLGEHFGARARSADDDLVDHAPDDILEARRVHGRPRKIGFDDAIDAGQERLRRALIHAEADDRLHARETDAGRRKAYGR